MSNRVFCPNCFKPTSYESSPGQFCSHCGKAFTDTVESIASKPTQIQKPVKQRQVIVEMENEEDEEIVNIPQIKKIEFEIDGNLRQNRQKLDEVLKEGVQSGGALGIGRPKNAPGKNPNKSAKEIQKEWLDNFPKNGQRTEI